jgi:flavin-dependent dehydrogenase
LTTDKGRYSAKYVLDSTGRDALMGKRFSSRTVNKDMNNVAVFAHYEGVQRRSGMNEGDITIGLLPNRSWTWIIPFKGGITSVGVVCSSSSIVDKSNMLGFMEDLLDQSKRVRHMMSSAQRTSEVQMIGNYSHITEKFYGERWLLVGDAAVFLDPIFSTGVHVAVSSGKFAAHAVQQALAGNLSFEQNSLGENYQKMVLKGVGRFRHLVGLFYDGNFVAQMKKTLTRENMRKGFTSVVAGDAWNDENFLFQKNVL